MPEGDTVWRTARSLDQALTGARITTSDFRIPSLAETDLSGLMVNGTFSRGKHLLTRIGDDLTLHSHLRMAGAWHLYRAESRWLRPHHQARVLLGTPRWIAVGFSLGVLELLPRAEEERPVAHLGPDLLGPDWDPAVALGRLMDAPERMIHEALLDQRNLAGIGNLYANELCFICGVHPETPVSEVPRLDRLLQRAHSLLDSNRSRRTRTTTGYLRHGTQLWVHEREGQPCQRCDTTIVRSSIGPRGRERAAYSCPHCQPHG